MKAHVLLLAFLTPILSVAGGLPLSYSPKLVENGPQKFIEHLGPQKGSAYLAYNVNYSAAEDVRNQLEAQLTKPLHHRGEAHITVLTPPEFESIKNDISIKEIHQIARQHRIQDSVVTPLCVGKGEAQIDGKTEQTFYIVVQSPDLVQIRQAIQKPLVERAGKSHGFEAGRFYPHITLGFTARDLFESDGVRKDSNSCVYPLLRKKYEPRVLNELLGKIRRLVAQGEKPAVLFDLDDTLINTKERNLRILKEFANTSEMAQKFPLEVVQIQGLTVDQIKYQSTDTLRSIGIENPELFEAVSDFWLHRFFTNEYSAKDIQISGASSYLQLVKSAGAQIIYLTGRDLPRMEIGTVESLRKNGFPLSNESASLVMKPDPKMDDFLFKQQALEEIRTQYHVVGIFENEPANLNLMIETFPEAISVFVDSLHSPKVDFPKPNAKWIRDYKLP